jgi:hypothetical protein
MNLEQYNALTGDTKLAAALAIAMGWEPQWIVYIVSWCANNIEVSQELDSGRSYRVFEPFADASIPYGLIGRGVDSVIGHLDGGFSAISLPLVYTSDYKTHAIVEAYIAADPKGHLNKFLKGE